MTKLETVQTVHQQILQILYINRCHENYLNKFWWKKVRYKMDYYFLHTALLSMVPLLSKT